MTDVEPGDGEINPFKISPDHLAIHAIVDSNHDGTKNMKEALYPNCIPLVNTGRIPIYTESTKKKFYRDYCRYKI